MTRTKQIKAFDNELHYLCLRYINEFDLAAEDLLDVVVREEMFLIAWAVEMAEQDYIEAVEEDDDEYPFVGQFDT